MTPDLPPSGTPPLGALAPSRAPARIVLADDHELARSGLRAMLEGEDDLAIVGEATDGEEAVRLCRELAPDLALLDIRMPRLDGLAAARAVRDLGLGTRVLMLTIEDKPDHLARAVVAGAAGYVLKDASRAELLAAIRTVLGGGKVLDSALAAALIGALARDDAPKEEPAAGRPAGGGLTARETDVLRLIVEGMTNKEIARALRIAPGTAKVHVERVIGKLGVADRTQAAVHAVQRGLIGRTS